MKKTAVKISIDIFMTIVWLILMTYDLTGSVWHEILGIGMLIPLFFHLFLNWKWIVSVSKKIFKTKPNVNTVRWISDVLMLIGYVLTAVSGIAISKELFWQIRADNNALWYTIHAWAAYVTLAAMGVHVGLHWKMVAGFFRSLFKTQKVTRTRRMIGAVISLAVIVYGIKSTIAYSLPTYTATDDAGLDYTVSELTFTEYGNEESSVKIINIDTRSSAGNTITETPNAGETLNNFLGRLFCNGCSRHCSLLSPGCSIGRSLVTEAKTIYTEFTASAANTSSAESTSSSASSAGTSSESVTSSTPSASSETESSESHESESESNGKGKGNGHQTQSEDESSTETSSAESSAETSSDESSVPESASSEALTPSVNNGEFFEYGSNILDNLSILGMYIAGTYYVVEFFGKKH